MGVRTYVLRNIVNDNGIPLQNVWCRAYLATTDALVETQYTNALGVATFTALPDNANVNILAIAGKNYVKWFYNVFSAGQDIMYGTLTVDHIDATSITLAALSGNLDDIDNGTTYQLLRATDISAGHIKLTTNVVWSGKVTVRSGITIDSSSGIDIFGVGNALTTRASDGGTIQCYVGADGYIYAGGGTCYLGYYGLTLTGDNTLRFVRGGYSSYIYPDAAGSIILGPSVATKAYNGFHFHVNPLPYTTTYYYFGDATHRWERMYGNPVLNATSAVTEGGLSCSGGANGILYVYASGAWRINNV